MKSVSRGIATCFLGCLSILMWPDVPVMAESPSQKSGGDTQHQAARGNSIIDFPANRIRITVPAGWHVAQQGKLKNHAWCILQRDGGKLPRPTVAILCGSEFVNQAPGGANFLGASPSAALLHATGRVLALSKDEPNPPYPRVEGTAQVTLPRYGPTLYCAHKMEFHQGTTLAVIAAKRRGGPLVAACFGVKDHFTASRTVMESILSQRYTPESKSRKGSHK